MGLIGFDKLSRRHAVSGLESPTNLEELRCRDVMVYGRECPVKNDVVELGGFQARRLPAAREADRAIKPPRD